MKAAVLESFGNPLSIQDVPPKQGPMLHGLNRVTGFFAIPPSDREITRSRLKSCYRAGVHGVKADKKSSNTI